MGGRFNNHQAFNYHKTATYICGYLLKDEDECSQAMKQVFKEVIESGEVVMSKTKSLAYSYSSK